MAAAAVVPLVPPLPLPLPSPPPNEFTHAEAADPGVDVPRGRVRQLPAPAAGLQRPTWAAIEPMTLFRATAPSRLAVGTHRARPRTRPAQ